MENPTIGAINKLMNMFQGCLKNISGMFQGCFKDITRMFQGYFNNVKECCQDASMMFVLRKLEVKSALKVLKRKFQKTLKWGSRCFREVSKVFPEYFKEVSLKFDSKICNVTIQKPYKRQLLIKLPARFERIWVKYFITRNIGTLKTPIFKNH